jgi:oligoendopeptidase F
MLPKTAVEFMDWEWPQIEPHYEALASSTLTADNVAEWLADWTRLSRLVSETYARHHVAISRDTTDQEAERRYHAFLDDIYPPAQEAEQVLKQKYLDSGLTVPDFEMPTRNMRAEAELFREENLPLLTEESKLSNEYDKIAGAQTVEGEGEERTIQALQPIYQSQDRNERERAWRLAAERQLADREALNGLWGRFLEVREQLAANADHADFRDFRWRQMLRFDYTPEDCLSFHRAIEEVVVPAASRVYARRQERLGLESLRPWDLDVDPQNRPPLRPFEAVEQLERVAGDIFQRTDPQLGDYFNAMRDDSLLDLDNRKGKAPGGYCTTFYVEKRPFIFMNAVGLHLDVQTLVHEAGHAFHVFERGHLPYHQQMTVGMEFAEVASMAMELLVAPYLAAGQGGFYTDEDAARARAEHLESLLGFWPYMAVVDAFQHWVHTHPEAAADPANCDESWAGLWARFMPDVDWSGLEREMMTGWQRKLHIFKYPFYYVEYGLAQLGAVQVWRNALQNQGEAVARYRQALALGGTVPLPDLFAAAGARLAFDADTLGEAVALLERTLAKLDPA